MSFQRFAGVLSQQSRFLPSDISGLRLWLRAESITGLADNDMVATWNDESGNGFHPSQIVEDRRPLYKTNIINGRPVVRGDGSNDYMSYSPNVTGVTDNWCLFGAWRNRGTGTSGEVALHNGARDTGFGAALSTDTNKKGLLRAGAAWNSSAVNEGTNWEAWLIRRNSGTTEVFVNGGTAILSTGSAPVAPSVRTIVFGRAVLGESGFVAADCDILECGVYNVGMSNDDTNRIGTYLAAKIGTTWTTVT